MSTVSTLRSHSREFLTEVIELYRSQPCLWKMKSKDYFDKEKKAEAYALLIEKFKENSEDVNAVDRNLVAKKINCMRSSYRQEKKRILDAAEVGRVYKTNLWCFELLRFLDENDKHQQRTSFISLDDNSNDKFEAPEYLQISADIYDSEASSPSVHEDPIGPLSKRSTTVNKHIESPRSNRKSRDSTDVPRKRKRLTHLDDAIYGFLDGNVDSKAGKVEASRIRSRHCEEGSSNERLDDAMTQFDYAAKAWALTLNELPRNQQLFASRIINEVLFQAQIGKLNEDTRLVISAPRTPHEDGPVNPVTMECVESDTVEFDMKGEV